MMVYGVQIALSPSPHIGCLWIKAVSIIESIQDGIGLENWVSLFRN